jgi:hypothetical protein
MITRKPCWYGLSCRFENSATWLHLVWMIAANGGTLAINRKVS